MMEYTVLIVLILVSCVIPFGILVFNLFKGKNEFVHKLIMILLGAITYFLTQWALKEKGLQWLFNHKKITGFDMYKFMTNHYILYLFLVPFFGSIFLYAFSMLIFRVVLKNKYTLKSVVMYGLTVFMCESIMISGVRSIYTLVEKLRGNIESLDVVTNELFLSAYERALLIIIGVSLSVIFAYFVQKKKGLLGFCICVLCGSLVGFLPGFLIAFSTKDFLEIYSKSTALILIYIFLTTAAFTGCVVLYNLRYSFEKLDCTKKNPKKKENN